MSCTMKNFTELRFPLKYKLIGIVLTTSLAVHSQWRHNGVPIVDIVANQGTYLLPQIAEDGEGGAIICWRDVRNGNYDIYAQRIDSAGYVQWQKDGIPICTAPLSQNFPRMISDGEGGAIIGWEDDRETVETYVYAQRVSHTGTMLWQTNGVRVSDKGGLFVRPVSDGHGGVIVAWWSKDFQLNYDQVYCQRLDRNGQRMWGDSGVVISSRSGVIPNNDIAITEDGKGGAIIAWVQDSIVYAQRVDSSGGIHWTPNGLVICNAAGPRGAVRITSDEYAAAFIAWADQRSGLSVYAQRVNPNGLIAWQLNGIPIQDGGAPRVVHDFHGGMIVAFNQTTGDCRIQRLDSLGNFQWDLGAVVYFPGSGGLTSNWNLINRDELGGSIVTWDLLIDASNVDVYAQAIDEAGEPVWQNNGVALVDDPSLQRFPQAVSDGKGGAIAAWDDQRSYIDSTVPAHNAVFAGRINANGVVTSVSSEVQGKAVPSDPILYPNYPNPFNPETLIRYYLPRSGAVKLIVYDLLGRPVQTLVDQYQHAGQHEVVWTGQKNFGLSVASGVYFYRMQINNSFITNKMILIR